MSVWQRVVCCTDSEPRNKGGLEINVFSVLTVAVAQLSLGKPNVSCAEIMSKTNFSWHRMSTTLFCHTEVFSHMFCDDIATNCSTTNMQYCLYYSQKQILTHKCNILTSQLIGCKLLLSSHNNNFLLYLKVNLLFLPPCVVWERYCVLDAPTLGSPQVKPLLAMWRAEEELKERDVSHLPQDWMCLQVIKLWREGGMVDRVILM